MEENAKEEEEEEEEGEDGGDGIGEGGHHRTVTHRRHRGPYRRTAALAARLQSVGCGLLTVHGRTRQQGGGTRTGGALASWEAIAACVRAVEIPVVLNGNIRVRADAEAAMVATGCVGVMSGCGLLRDAYLFERPLGGAGGGGGKRVEVGDAGGGDVGRGAGT